MFPEERDTGSFKAAKYNRSLLLSTHKQFGLLSSSERREKSAILGLPSRCSGGGIKGRRTFWPGGRETWGLGNLAWGISPTGTNWCQVSVSRRIKCVFTLRTHEVLRPKQLEDFLGRKWQIISANLHTHTHSVLKDINKLTPELLFTTMLRSDNH